MPLLKQILNRIDFVYEGIVVFTTKLEKGLLKLLVVLHIEF